MTTTASTTTTISAPPEHVWALLTDADWWNRADNGVVDVSGTIREGQKIKLVSELDPKRGFALRVAEVQAPRHMVWTGGMPLGLFTGRRTFTLEPAGDAACTFTMAEAFSGLLAPLILRSMPDFQASFDQFASALKTDSEA
ncbi:Polyketide cyclase / dehydrase and lipid transport [Nocardioides dokdonensis FR1436]|uniref:Polyketide cyclase / dehydrase and lipid transport n=1 Tax=Nocardioides dokdonensis FR1436 TaxID=1300347 RepID=A0A1A9GRG9_9ACTN|nr:SRPBCC domain-containing protein [Nocardioides dokdonensis]ANH40055.1 Polyketide cyclase / dehydrase and lipid transport [Nocardioides dokdonensis FR1436]